MPANPLPAATPGMAWLPLGLALLLTAALTIFPGLATDAAGRADHPAALLLFWAMSAGLVRGVGFIPRHWLAHWPLSGPACLIALLLALARLKAIGNPFLFH